MKLLASKFLNCFLVIAVILGGSLLSPSLASANTGPQPWGGECVVDGVATVQGLECLVANVFMVIITLIGFAGFVMMVVASFMWLLSGGNTKGMESARNTMTFAVVGIVVALSAFIILNLISDFTGVEEILNFRVPKIP